ncbi:hypothetical protein Tco_0237111 [Tanacetum coccineum]
MDFPLLAQLESHKDTSMSDIIDLFRLEGPAAEIPEASQLHPPPEQLMLPIHRIRRDVTARRLSLSESMVPLIEPLSIENLLVPPIPQTEAPPSYSIVFEKEELDTTPKHPTAS